MTGNNPKQGSSVLKKLCGFVLLSPVFCLPLTACAAELGSATRVVTGFHRISIAISGEIDLQRGGQESLTIEAPTETLKHIVTEVRDGELRIYKERGSWNLRGPIRIELTYRGLDGLDLSGSAEVHTDTLVAESFDVAIRGSSDVRVAGFEVDRLEVTVSGSGDLEADEVVAESVSISVSGSGDVTLNGTAAAQTVVVRGSGNVDTRRLESRSVTATVSGSGNVKLLATGSLSATISGSGDIIYEGEPGIESRISGSGRLRPN